MKKNIALSIVSAAVIGSIATPVLAGFSQEASDATALAITNSAEFSTDSVNYSIGKSQDSAAFSQKMGKKSADGSEAIYKFIVRQVNNSADQSMIILSESKDASKEASSAVKDSAVKVFTKSGDIFEASTNAAKDLIGVSLEKVEESKDVLVKAGKHTVGKLQSSAEYSAEKIDYSVGYSMNVSGEIYAGSKQSYAESKKMIGKAVTGAGNAIKFVATQSGEFLTESKDKTVLVLTASGDSMSKFSTDLGKALKNSSTEVAVLVTASADNTYLLVKDSSQASGDAVIFVSNKVAEFMKRITYKIKGETK